MPQTAGTPLLWAGFTLLVVSVHESGTLEQTFLGLQPA